MDRGGGYHTRGYWETRALIDVTSGYMGYSIYIFSSFIHVWIHVVVFENLFERSCLSQDFKLSIFKTTSFNGCEPFTRMLDVLYFNFSLLYNLLYDITCGVEGVTHLFLPIRAFFINQA